MADNLVANYSRDVADYIINVIDVAGGDKVPRKGGPGITQSDLLVSGHMTAHHHITHTLLKQAGLHRCWCEMWAMVTIDWLV